MEAPKKILTPQEKLNQNPQRSPINDTHIENITGGFEVVGAVPDGIPKKFWDSVKIYINGGTKRIYFYVKDVGWLYTALT